MTIEHKRIDTGAIRQSVDLVEFAGQYTRLTQISRRGEFAGPCPCCGGEDRFHVVVPSGRFYCRQCRPRGGDVIDLVQMVHGVDFLEACQLLADNTFPPSERQAVAVPTRAATEQSVPRWQSALYQESAYKTLLATRRLLGSREGSVGQGYLHARGLDGETWHTYGLGFGGAFHPVRREFRDAIFIPWLDLDGTSITAIQHRFIDPDLGKGERYSQKPGSEPLLFGLQALGSRGAGDEFGAETLCIVEGEINYMSLHQCGVEALSVGSEVNAGNERTLTLLQKQLPGYQRLIFWFDNPAYAEQAAARLDGQGPFRKENMHHISLPLDANQLLADGELQAFVETLLDDAR